MGKVWREGGLKREGEPDADFGFGHLGPDLAVVGLHQFFDNGEADACPPVFAGP